MQTKLQRILFGILSIVLSALFLLSELPTFIKQRLSNNTILWYYWFMPEFHAGGWIIALILLVSGFLLISKNRLSQIIYHLFGISIIIESILRIINYDKALFLGFLIIIPISIGIFTIYSTYSKHWKEKFNWNKQLNFKILILNFCLAIVISGFPRIFLKGM